MTPAANGPVRVRYATPGVVMMPAKRERTPCVVEPAGKLSGEPRTRFARVHPDHDFRLTGSWPDGVAPQRHADGVHRHGIERIYAGYAADPVRPEEFLRH